MLVGELVFDNYWTDRSVLLPDATLQFLQDSALLPSFEVSWIDGTESGSFTLRKVVDLLTAVQYENLRRINMRFDRREKESNVFAYTYEYGKFAIATVGGPYHGGQP